MEEARSLRTIADARQKEMKERATVVATTTFAVVLVRSVPEDIVEERRSGNFILSPRYQRTKEGTTAWLSRRRSFGPSPAVGRMSRNCSSITIEVTFKFACEVS